MAANADHPAAIASVTAPVIAGAEDAALLNAYVESLRKNDLKHLSLAESARLNPYIAAMSGYLADALDRDTGNANLTPVEKKNLVKLIEPASLSHIFNEMSAFARNLLLSDVSVMTTEVLEDSATKHLFLDKKRFDVGYQFCGHSMRFGFLRVNSDKTHGARSSTTFPTFMLDHAVTSQLPQDRVKPLFEDLKKMITIVNHDIMHHMTLPIMNEDIIDRNNREDITHTPLRGWKPLIPHKTHQENVYEEWAHLSHERILLFSGDSNVLKDVKTVTDDFFDHLQQARDDMSTQGQSPETIAETVDYMSTAMLHALSRLVPLNHPVMLHALSRAEAVDPASDSVMEKTLAALMNHQGALHLKPEQTASMIRAIATGKPGVAEVVQSYLADNHELLPQDAHRMNYNALKSLQLAALSPSDMRAHAPKPIDPLMVELHKRHDKTMLHMVLAAARTVRYHPS